MKLEFLEMAFNNWNITLPRDLKEASKYALVTPILKNDGVEVEVKTTTCTKLFMLNKDGKVLSIK